MESQSGGPPSRSALAATDLIVGFLIASIAYVGLGANVWITVAGVLAYHTAGRLLSDEPFLFWLFRRMRTAAPSVSVEPETEDVPVGDAARTTA